MSRWDANRFLFSGYTFQQEQDLKKARERSRTNWDRHFTRIITETKKKIAAG